MAKPNILFIMMDQCRFDALGCTGDWGKTPNIDTIAAQGTVFTNCVTNAPLCIPARVSLATGLYCHNTGVWENIPHDIDPETRTWMGAIRDAGYRTSLFGKTHLHRHQGDLRDREDIMHAIGLDDVNEIGGPRASRKVLSHMTALWEEKGIWDDYKADYTERFQNKQYVARPSVLPLEDYADVYVGQRCREYLEQYDRDNPWFAWVSFGGPHEPYDAPEPYASMYDPADMAPPRTMFEDPARRPQGGFDKRRQANLDKFTLTLEEVGACKANYAGNVTLIDDQIGEILEVIAQRGELDNTVILLTSDHGEMNGDYDMLSKSNFTDSAVRVPFIVRIPGQKNQGSICDTPVEWMDAGATLADLAGAELTYPHYACSVVKMANGSGSRPYDGVVSELDEEVMFMDSKYKAAINKEGQIYLLFDRQNDPLETNNLAGRAEYKELETSLRLRILKRLMGTPLNLAPRKGPDL